MKLSNSLTIYNTSEISSKSVTSASSPTGSTEARVPLVPAVPRYFDICGVAPPLIWPPLRQGQGGSQRLKIKPGPSRVLQIVLHRLRLWGFAAKSYFPLCVRRYLQTKPWDSVKQALTKTEPVNSTSALVNTRFFKAYRWTTKLWLSLNEWGK